MTVVGPARSSVSSVLRAYWISKITGEYWENEVDTQSRVMSKQPQKDRIIFFQGVLLNCPMETSRALTFVENVDGDAEALRESLVSFRETKGFEQLTRRQKANIQSWLDELPIVIELEKQKTSAVSRGLPQTKNKP